MWMFKYQRRKCAKVCATSNWRESAYWIIKWQRWTTCDQNKVLTSSFIQYSALLIILFIFIVLKREWKYSLLLFLDLTSLLPELLNCLSISQYVCCACYLLLLLFRKVGSLSTMERFVNRIWDLRTWKMRQRTSSLSWTQLIRVRITPVIKVTILTLHRPVLSNLKPLNSALFRILLYLPSLSSSRTHTTNAYTHGWMKRCLTCFFYSDFYIGQSREQGCYKD